MKKILALILSIFLAFSGQAWAAGVAISDLPAVTSTTGATDVVPVVASGVTSKITVDNLRKVGSVTQAYDADLGTLAAPTAWRMFYSNGSSVITELGLGTAGQVLTSNGATSAPTWGAAGAGNFLADGSIPMTGAILPDTTNSYALGSQTYTWADLFLGDSAVIKGQNDGSAILTSSAGLWTASSFAVNTQFKLPSSDADPTATAGYLRHDATVTNHANGALRWHDGTNIRQIVDMVAATAEGCQGGYVVAYDSTNDYFYCKVDSTGGSPTFETIASGENSGATMVLLAGASLSANGGTITATSVSDTELAAIQGLTFADASIIQLTGTTTAGVLTSGGNNYFLKSNSDNSAIEFATPAAALTAIGGQPLNSDLTTIAGLSPAAGKVIIGSTSPAWSLSANSLPTTACATGTVLKASSSGVFGCGTDNTSGTPYFSEIQSQTNTSAAMVVGGTASLTTSGGGSIVATGLTAIDAAGDVVVGSADNTPTKIQKGENNSFFGVDNAGTLGFYTTMLLNDSAAQFYNSTNTSRYIKMDVSGLTADSTYSIKPVAAANTTLLLGNTFTDTKLCSYSTTTGLNCNSDAGAGDVTGAGDCASGACYDGTSDGGTYLRLYDGANYVGIVATTRTFTFNSSVAASEDLALTLGNNNNTVTWSTGSGATTMDFSALNLVSTGTISGKIPMITKSADYTLGSDSAQEAYGYMVWLSGNYTLTLPAVTAGMNVCVYSTDATAKLIDPNASDGIRNGTATRNADGHKITSGGSAGDYVCLVADSADGWTVLGKTGTWTDE